MFVYASRRDNVWDSTGDAVPFLRGSGLDITAEICVRMPASQKISVRVSIGEVGGKRVLFIDVYNISLRTKMCIILDRNIPFNVD